MAEDNESLAMFGCEVDSFSEDIADISTTHQPVEDDQQAENIHCHSLSLDLRTVAGEIIVSCVDGDHEELTSSPLHHKSMVLNSVEGHSLMLPLEDGDFINSQNKNNLASLLSKECEESDVSGKARKITKETSKNGAQYEIIEKGSKRGKDILVSNDGYCYTVKTSTVSQTTWVCAIRSSTQRCAALVKEKGTNTFLHGNPKHNHPADLKMVNGLKMRRKGQEANVVHHRRTTPNQRMDFHFSPGTASPHHINTTTLQSAQLDYACGAGNIKAEPRVVDDDEPMDCTVKAPQMTVFDCGASPTSMQIKQEPT